LHEPALNIGCEHCANVLACKPPLDATRTQHKTWL
jgi:hypothetical protein